jgi:accessory gene regulator B
MGKPFAWIAFLVGFAPLRTTAGGYHASSHMGCYCISTIVYGICLSITMYVPVNSKALIGLTMVAFIIILLFSPVEAPNKRLTETVRKCNRKRSIIMVACESLLVFIIGCIGTQNEMITLCYLGIFAAAVSLIASKIKNLRRR